MSVNPEFKDLLLVSLKKNVCYFFYKHFVIYVTWKNVYNLFYKHFV